MSALYPLSSKQLSAVSKLAGPVRYKHFVARVADWQFVWGLRNESGWVAAGDDTGKSRFPVWPHPEYAAACALAEWGDTTPHSIEVHEFVENWLPDMAAKEVFVAVFPTPGNRGVLVPPSRLAENVLEELSRTE